MKQIIAIALVTLSLLFAFPAQASMLMPVGGWLLDDASRVRTYTDYQKIYRLAAEKIVGHDNEGSPLVETITFVDTPFDPQSTALGFRHCKAKSGAIGVTAVYSMAESAVKYAWIFDGKVFHKIPTSEVVCNKQLLLD